MVKSVYVFVSRRQMKNFWRKPTIRLQISIKITTKFEASNKFWFIFVGSTWIKRFVGENYNYEKFVSMKGIIITKLLQKI